MTRALVTGGEGFIGRHLTAALLARGDQVIVLGRPCAAPAPVRSGAETVRIDLTDRAALDALFSSRRIDVVYHLASATRRRPSPDLSDWTGSVAEDLGTLVTLVSAAATARTPPRVMVRAGSIAEYGAAPLPFREAGPALPNSAYGAALLSGTTYLRAMEAVLPFRVATARLALTYGPGQKTDFLAAKLMADLPRGFRLTVGRPEDRRSMIYVDDVVDALMRLAERPVPLVNIGTQDVPSMRELAHLVAELAGCDPGLLQFGHMTGPPVILRPDTRLVASALGWTARYDLRGGIAHCLAREGVASFAL